MFAPVVTGVPGQFPAAPVGSAPMNQFANTWLVTSGPQSWSYSDTTRVSCLCDCQGAGLRGVHTQQTVHGELASSGQGSREMLGIDCWWSAGCFWKFLQSHIVTVSEQVWEV